MASYEDLELDTKQEAAHTTATPSVKESTTNAALNELLGGLLTKLTDYVGKRYEKEQEWIIAEQQYSGLLDQIDDKKMKAMGMRGVASIPIVNITRPKTNIAIARLQDTQFPLGGDLNFSVNHTPVPEMLELSKSQELMPVAPPLPAVDGGIVPPVPTIGDAATSSMRRAKDAAGKMEAKIHDRLVECSYAKTSRLAMEQQGRLGTGVLKAPVLAHKQRKSYQSMPDSDGNDVQAMQMEYDIVPTVQWVDIRTWFPDPSARPGTSILDSFELHLLTSKELVDLSHNPAFMPNRLRDVLRTSPESGNMAKSHMLDLLGNNTDTLSKRYAVMEYHGPLDKQVAVELDLITEEEADDPLVIIQGEVWFCNGHIIRVSVAPLEGEECIPYFVATWEDDQNSIFGHGIPYLMRHAARVINSSWLMLLDNAGLTAGPQIVLNKEMIQPANEAEGWEIKPMKIWFMTEYGADVEDAMQFVNVPTQQESITNIIELALQFADIESSIPQILQGELPAGNNTFGGIAMVMTASHIVQKKISERWDDNIVVPIVERFYHYEMQFGEDPEVKGDFEVNAGGATERIDKQTKAQDLERIIGMAGSNPEFMAHLDIGLAFREWVATTRAGEILKSLEQVEAEMAKQQAAPPPDPELIEAEARSKQADAALGKLELDKVQHEKEYDLKAQIAEAMVDKENREIVTRGEENEIKLQIQQMVRDDMLTQMAYDSGVTQAELAQKLKIAVVAEETKRLLKAADIDKFNTEIAVKREFGEGI